MPKERGRGLKDFCSFLLGISLAQFFFFLDVFVDMIRWVKSLKITYSESNKKCDATGQKSSRWFFF
jgi:hypothetical protein